MTRRGSPACSAAPPSLPTAWACNSVARTFASEGGRAHRWWGLPPFARQRVGGGGGWGWVWKGLECSKNPSSMSTARRTPRRCRRLSLQQCGTRVSRMISCSWPISELWLSRGILPDSVVQALNPALDRLNSFLSVIWQRHLANSKTLYAG